MLAVIACSSREHVQPGDDERDVPMSRLAEHLLTPTSSAQTQWGARYYEGYLAEQVHGDMSAARAAYEAVIAEAGDQAPEIAARAALRLAELEALVGKRRKAVELMARASVLGRDNLDIVEQADRLQARLGSLRRAGSEVRGPPIGTTFDAVPKDVADAFAQAEELLMAYHRIRLRPRLEQLGAGVRAKENAMEAAVRAYRQVTVLTEPAVQIAAEFRIASLYHDLALSLMFDLPPELEPRAAAKLRRSLRSSALGYLDKARAAYRRCLDSHQTSGRSIASERWSVAAKLGARSVEDLLGG